LENIEEMYKFLDIYEQQKLCQEAIEQHVYSEKLVSSSNSLPTRKAQECMNSLLNSTKLQQFHKIESRVCYQTG
jgi:hypothetical protein